MTDDDDQSYELKIRILGNEIFAIALSSTSTNNKWIAIALISMFSFMTVLGAYGRELVDLYRTLVG